MPIEHLQLLKEYLEDNLMGTNVFTFHVNSREISFQSTVMQRFCEENATDWEEK